VLPALLLLRPVAALGGAGTDKIALHVCEAAEHGNLNISVAGGTSGSNPLSSTGESSANSVCPPSPVRDSDERRAPLAFIAHGVTINRPLEPALLDQ
jgi:hypothetical protein